MKKYFPALRHFNIPNAITTLGMVFGLFAAFFVTQQEMRMVILFLFLAGVMDLIDGLVAARLKQLTEFGQYLDTLVDFFTCGIIPIIMVFSLDAFDANPLIIITLVFYCICALWRLAYYNIIEAKGHFTGLPVPGAMAIVTVTVWCVVMYDIVPAWILAIVFVGTGVLMVSGVKLTKYGWWQKLMCVLGLAFFVLVIVSLI